MKLFSKERQEQIPAKNQTGISKFKKYILYALGEIILVVIGILIAVSINNYNEANQEKQRLNTYLKDYKNDLIIDSSIVANNLKVLDDRREAFKLVMSDTLNKETLMQNPQVFSLIMTYVPFKLQNKGYNELKTYAANNETETDTLVQRIVSEHAAYGELLETTLDRISRDIDNNIEDFKENKPWIADLFSNKITEEIKDYFVSSEFRNRAAVHQILVYGNLYQFLKAYKAYIDKTLKSLESRLKE